MTTQTVSPTKQWMLDHPDDVPCPRSPHAAKAWRIKRGLQRTKADAEAHLKYTVAMIETRCCKQPLD
jgi:hypothetical protein